MARAAYERVAVQKAVAYEVLLAIKSGQSTAIGNKLNNCVPVCHRLDAAARIPNNFVPAAHFQAANVLVGHEIRTRGGGGVRTTAGCAA